MNTIQVIQGKKQHHQTKQVVNFFENKKKSKKVKKNIIATNRLKPRYQGTYQKNNYKFQKKTFGLYLKFPYICNRN